MSAREKRTPGWVYLLMLVIGAALIAIGLWLDVRDGVPTTRKGDQPIEVVVALGVGIMLLGGGLVGIWRAYKGWRDLDGGPRA